MARRRKTLKPGGFDREGFLLGVGVGGLCLGTGLLIGWATLTAPEGASPSTTGYTTAQRLARMLPEQVQAWLALGFAGLLVLFGIVVFMAGLGVAVKYVVSRFRSPRLE